MLAAHLSAPLLLRICSRIVSLRSSPSASVRIARARSPTLLASCARWSMTTALSISAIWSAMTLNNRRFCISFAASSFCRADPSLSTLRMRSTPPALKMAFARSTESFAMLLSAARAAAVISAGSST
eukprot:3094328-Prymnesium_polylepis.1